MRQYVLTRAAYGPEWPRDANARRLRITRGITARMMELQTNRDWTWIALLDPRDQLLEERIAVFKRAAPALIPILWTPTDVKDAPWDKHPIGGRRAKVAATAYRAPWRQAVGPADDRVLMTRLDDDDALARNTLARVRRASQKVSKRAILMNPIGFRVWNGQYSRVRHNGNAMQTLLTPPGDDLCVYDYGHRLGYRVAPVVVVDMDPAWLWTRHRDTLSGWQRANIPISESLSKMFPVDWEVLR